MSSPSYGSPETRRRILEAAWRILETKGTGLTLANVASAAGVSRQAVYLHFRDRTGLLLALVAHIDTMLGSDQRIADILNAPSGIDALERMVEALSRFTERIDAVARTLEAAEYEDEALRAAWRDRLAGRQAISRAVVQRIAQDGQLANGWSLQDAADLVYAVTMPGPWRELTRHLGWTPRQYAANVIALLRRGLVAR